MVLRPLGPLVDVTALLKGFQKGLEIYRRLRPGEQTSLRSIAPQRPEPVHLTVALDPFGDDGEPERVSHLDDRPDDPRARLIFVQCRHEGLVDLQQLSRQLLEGGEG